MHRHILSLLLLSSCVVCAFQHSFQAAEQVPDWDFDAKPSVNETGNILFATASSLLQHWPNTRYRNGHTIVPVIVPPGTLLYHGRGDNRLPDEPDWTATDPEHSYMFCEGSSEDGCWHLTLVATRPLRILYFDGNSAAKMSGGPLDSQDLAIWGKIMPDKFMAEWERVGKLCEWGKAFGIDGIARMEMDFEIILCNFTAGVDVVSFLNLKAQPDAWNTPPRGDFPGHHRPSVALATAAAKATEVIISGSWHNRFPGEIRMQADYGRLVSFYDTSLAPSLVAQRLGKHRLKHHLSGIDVTDVHAVMQRLEDALLEDNGRSGIDWSTLFQVLIDRFADRLEDLQYYTRNETVDGMKNAHGLLATMIQPYMLHSLKPVLSDNQSWAAPTFELCTTTHTVYMEKNPFLTISERLLFSAVRTTTREICRVVVRMWAQGVENIDHLDASPQLAREWADAVDGLVDWLDWSVWLKCRPACDYQSICYLPTWPFFWQGPGGGRPGGPGRGPGGPGKGPGGPRKGPWRPVPLDVNMDDGVDSSEDPQPRCVPRVNLL